MSKYFASIRRNDQNLFILPIIKYEIIYAIIFVIGSKFIFSSSDVYIYIAVR